MENTQRNFHVLVFPGQECYVAQFLECDIVTQAPTREELRSAIGNLIAAHLDFAVKEGKEPFEGLERAPKAHWDAFDGLRAKGYPFDVVEVDFEDVTEDECASQCAAMMVFQ